MLDKENKQEMLYWADLLGTPVSESTENLKFFEVNEVKIIGLLPEMLLIVRSVVARETFSLRRKSIDLIKRGLLISFQNVFNDQTNQPIASQELLQQRPHVRISPVHLESEVIFPKEINIKQIIILVELDYLKKFIGNDNNQFDYLFKEEKTFLIEEFMSPDIANIVNEVAAETSAIILSDAYYRLKSLELLYHLFKNLSGRQHITHQNLSNYEIKVIYKVRDQISSSLYEPFAQDDLVKMSGMNVIKLRKLFMQVFGKGLYDYYQHLRMQEAARLMKQERLSVSEAAYKLGFTNVSHFGRLFERYFGIKPKKWMSQKL